MSDLDFKAGETDGNGQNWPTTYCELAPFYAKVERLLEVNGTCDAIPQLPDGCFSVTPPASTLLLHMREAFARCGPKLIPARISVRSSSGRSSCIRCGRVNAGCIEHAASVNSTLAAAMRTGRLTIFSNAIVRHLVSDREGNATAVYVIDRESRREFEIFGGMFFLCASTLESTRILLNSASVAHPAGFGNSSGTLGHYLMDHVSGISLTARFRYCGNTGENGPRPVHLLYVPRSHNLGHNQPRDFLRGYGWQVTAMRADDFSPDTGPGCGARTTKPYPQTIRKLSDTFVFRMQAFGEMLPRFENYIEIDPSGLLDAWGIPALRIHCAHGENEQAMARDMVASAYAFADALGASVISCDKAASEPGVSAHEAGTCRMGPDPKTSVLNRFNQCHDAPNVFVTDGSSFASQGTQNPTLTMMALTARACEYAVQQAHRNDLKRHPKPRKASANQ